jgi:hypothetical protein
MRRIVDWATSGANSNTGVAGERQQPLAKPLVVVSMYQRYMRYRY